MFESDVEKSVPSVLSLWAMTFSKAKRCWPLTLRPTGVSTQRDRIVQFALIGTLEDGTSVNLERIVNPKDVNSLRCK